MTTRVFPGLASDRMALKLNGNDDRLTLADFRQLARAIDVPAGRAETLIAELVHTVHEAAGGLVLPPVARAAGAEAAGG